MLWSQSSIGVGVGGRGRDRQLWPSFLIFASLAPIVFLCFPLAPPYLAPSSSISAFPPLRSSLLPRGRGGPYPGPGHALGSGLCVPCVVGAPGVVCGSEDGNCFPQFGTLASCGGRSDFSRHSVLQRALVSPFCKSRVRRGGIFRLSSP